MSKQSTVSTLEQMYSPVKSDTPEPWYHPRDSMIHHNVWISKTNKMIVSYSRYGDKRYGVSRSRRALTPELLLKKFDHVRNCLEHVLGLTPCQREAVLRLLRLWSYYGNVYPKESLVTSEPGCSKATFWRTLRIMQDQDLIQVVNRFVIRPHAQISNLYRLDKLIVLLARYLSEHISHVWPEYLEPFLDATLDGFYDLLDRTPGDIIARGGLAF